MGSFYLSIDIPGFPALGPDPSRVQAFQPWAQKPVSPSTGPFLWIGFPLTTSCEASELLRLLEPFVSMGPDRPQPPARCAPVPPPTAWPALRHAPCRHRVRFPRLRRAELDRLGKNGDDGAVTPSPIGTSRNSSPT
jgi:hypothetical protein